MRILPPNELGRMTQDQVGRYVIERKLGEGGMGVVYAAYDPGLDRHIAVKLLRRELWEGDSATHGAARLLREAQAMARLQHPNVVTVFDVGTHDEQLYVAMEHIDGTTLRRWLSTESPQRTEIIAAFVAAGRGLAAAHAAGIVHRDFKPENVLRSRTGRICVADFGLAHSIAPMGAHDPLGDAQGAAPGAFGIRVTQSGTVFGTPAYMAPEQIDGGRADARTDQFSFGVALYEALYGELPFAGGTFEEIAHEIQSGRLRAAKPGARVPERLRQILVRSFAHEPAARFPSMDALLNELAPSKATRRWIVAVVAVAVLSISGAIAYQASRPALVCRGNSQKLAGVWDAVKRRASHAAFATTKLPYAESAWARAASALDSYVGAWSSMRTEACEATRVRGEQSEHLLDLRMACLDERLDDLRALSTLFSSADESTVEHADSSLETLRPLARCADVKQLNARLATPEDKATRDRIDALTLALAETRALLLAGKVNDVARGSDALVQKAQDLHYAPLIAEAHSLAGRAALKRSDFATAVGSFKKGLVLAEAAGDDEQTATLWNHLMRAYVEENDLKDAADALDHGRAFAQRLASSPNLNAELDYTTSIMQAHAGKLDLAKAAASHAYETWQKLGNDRAAARALGALSNFAGIVGNGKDALDYAIRCRDLDLAVLGPDHPDLITDYDSVGNALISLNRLDEGLAAYKQGLDLAQRSVSPDSPAMAKALGNYVNGLHTKGRYAEALVWSKRVLEIMGKTDGTTSAIYAQALSNLASTELALGKVDDAQAHLEQALAIKEKVLGPEHDEVARTLVLLGNVAGDKHEFSVAVRRGERAIAIFEKTVAPTSFDLADADFLVGRAYWGMKQYEKAVAPYERALKIYNTVPETPEIGNTHFALGQNAFDAGDRTRARSELTLALPIFHKNDPQKNLPKTEELLAKLR